MGGLKIVGNVMCLCIAHKSQPTPKAPTINLAQVGYYIVLVYLVPLAQVWTSYQLIFPSKIIFLDNLI
jgi:hypothetical protein